MSMQDPIADLLTHIRNGHSAKKDVVRLPFSKMKLAIVNVLADEGYVIGSSIIELTPAKKELEVKLKYHDGKPVIVTIDRASKPSLRTYSSRDELPVIKSGLGICIVSTSKGVMSDRKARELGHGGEVLCYVT